MPEQQFHWKTLYDDLADSNDPGISVSDEVRPSPRLRRTRRARRGTAAPRGGLPGPALRQPAGRRVQVKTKQVTTYEARPNESRPINLLLSRRASLTV